MPVSAVCQLGQDWGQDVERQVLERRPELFERRHFGGDDFTHIVGIVGDNIEDRDNRPLPALNHVVYHRFGSVRRTGHLSQGPSGSDPSCLLASLPDFWQAVKGSARVYLEAYTSILMIAKDRLVRKLGTIIVSTQGLFNSLCKGGFL